MSELNTSGTTTQQAADIVREVFEEAENKLLSNMPLYSRYCYMINQICSILDKRGCTEVDINWKLVNEKLYANLDTYENNICRKVNSLEDLREARSQCIEASLLNLAWRKGICKDCHQEFTLSLSEVEFFRTRGLALPKRCKCCRDKRKTQGGNK